MDGTRRRLSDEALERELGMAFDVDPSPEFLARVRTRIASESAPSWWRQTFPQAAILSMAGVAALVLAASVYRFLTVEQQSTAARRPVPAIQGQSHPTSTPSVAAGERHAGARRLGEGSIETIRAVVAAETDGTVPLELSPVLVSDSERRAFDQFVRALSEGRVPQPPVESQSADESLDLAGLKIEPLVIAPMPPLARVEFKGEGQW